MSRPDDKMTRRPGDQGTRGQGTSTGSTAATTLPALASSSHLCQVSEPITAADGGGPFGTPSGWPCPSGGGWVGRALRRLEIGLGLREEVVPSFVGRAPACWSKRPLLWLVRFQILGQDRTGQGRTGQGRNGHRRHRSPPDHVHLFLHAIAVVERRRRRAERTPTKRGGRRSVRLAEMENGSVV